MVSKERRKEIEEKHKLNNPQSNLLASRRYRERNKEKVSATGKKYRFKYYTDINYKLTVLNRSRISSALKGLDKAESTVKMLGCSIDDLKKHLESLFEPGMTWENRGEWHVDHKLPCASFNLIDPEEQKKCFHYTNLQPLWAIDNIRKSNKLEWKK